MNNAKEFAEHARQLTEWMANYLENIRELPVRSQVSPGQILASLPSAPPEQAESFEAIFADFRQDLLKGITHWQHPSFFAYFPANSSYPSLLAEMLTAALGAQCMIWETSPAAAELEERMMQWLLQMTGLPTEWHGVIQDTASSATLCALLTAREQATNYQINENGWAGIPPLAIYCSQETHSSIEKAAKIAGFGRNMVRKIPTDAQYALLPEQLEAAIQADLAAGVKPVAVVATLGTTSSTAMDPLPAIGQICQRFGVWLHVDAAYAGTAAVLPECRWMNQGAELADSYVFNPHKWMFTNFDCTAYFVRDKDALIRTFSIMPEYLKTAADSQVNNYRDWGIQLGRRFRALKLWFVIRGFGVEGIRDRLREHLRLAHWFADAVAQIPDVRIMAPVHLNLVCFRFEPSGLSAGEQDAYNQKLMEVINRTGKAYLTHTRLSGLYTIRAVFGQTHLEQADVEALLHLIGEMRKTI